ncbi:VanZ like family protein [Neorhodopirellula lusitana]|uniref:VanZ like family protein n=2 Tax=Neorhodopirellula lusitana TaxID=445327 RepID=A0ABY1Q1W7_9BACT|nr:VanZ like family protein [Neorhodopirellula lusitana]
MQPVSGIRLFGARLAVLLLAVYWCSMFTGTHLPKIPRAMPRINDKILHFSAFFGLAMLLCYCTNSRRLLKRFGIIAAVCLTYGMLDEWTQSFVRGRSTDIYDFAADATGTLLAISLYATVRVIWGRRSPSFRTAAEAS